MITSVLIIIIITIHDQTVSRASLLPMMSPGEEPSLNMSPIHCGVLKIKPGVWPIYRQIMAHFLWKVPCHLKYAQANAFRQDIQLNIPLQDCALINVISC